MLHRSILRRTRPQLEQAKPATGTRTECKTPNRNENPHLEPKLTNTRPMRQGRAQRRAHTGHYVSPWPQNFYGTEGQPRDLHMEVHACTFISSSRIMPSAHYQRAHHCVRTCCIPWGDLTSEHLACEPLFRWRKTRSCRLGRLDSGSANALPPQLRRPAPSAVARSSSMQCAASGQCSAGVHATTTLMVPSAVTYVTNVHQSPASHQLTPNCIWHDPAGTVHYTRLNMWRNSWRR